MRSAGYTVVEALVSLLLTVMIAAAVLGLSSASSHLAATQFDRAELQQAARASQRELVEHARMLGRGGLPATGGAATLPDGLALAVRNNVAAGTPLLPTAPVATQPVVAEGTDILTFRGVFASPIYQINHQDESTFTFDGAGGTLVIDALTYTGVPQDLAPLIDLIDQAQAGTVVPEALILVSPVDDARYAVVELAPQASAVGPGNQRLTLRFLATGGRAADAYAQLTPGGTFPVDMVSTGVAFVGILEEYRYYVREQANAGRDPSFYLSRARTLPGTDIAYADDAAQLTIDLAENVLDLQVALGFDSVLQGQWEDDLDDIGPDDQIFETTDGLDDDWLFNSAGDDPTAAPWNGLPVGVAPPRLYYLRFSTLTRAPQRRRGVQAKEILALEDRVYDVDAANEATERLYQRTVLRTAVDMRNLG